MNNRKKKFSDSSIVPNSFDFKITIIFVIKFELKTFTAAVYNKVTEQLNNERSFSI